MGSSVHNHEVKKKKAIARSQSRLNKRETGTSLMDLDDTSSDDDDDENPLLAANRAAGVRHPGMDALNRALKEVEEEHVKSKNLKALVNKKKIMNGAFGKGHRKHKHREGKESKRFNLDEQIAFKNGGEELHSPLGLKKKKTMTDQRKERGDKRKARQDQLTKQKTLLESKEQSQIKDEAPVAGIFDVSSDESGDDAADAADADDTAPKDSGGLFDDADADVMGGLFDDDTAPQASGQDADETAKIAPVIPAAKIENIPAKPATPPTVASGGLFDVSSDEDEDDY